MPENTPSEPILLNSETRIKVLTSLEQQSRGHAVNFNPGDMIYFKDNVGSTSGFKIRLASPFASATVDFTGSSHEMKFLAVADVLSGTNGNGVDIVIDDDQTIPSPYEAVVTTLAGGSSAGKLKITSADSSKDVHFCYSAV